VGSGRRDRRGRGGLPTHPGRILSPQRRPGSALKRRDPISAECDDPDVVAFY